MFDSISYAYTLRDWFYLLFAFLERKPLWLACNSSCFMGEGNMTLLTIYVIFFSIIVTGIVK